MAEVWQEKTAVFSIQSISIKLVDTCAVYFYTHRLRLNDSSQLASLLARQMTQGVPNDYFSICYNTLLNAI